MKPEIRSFKNYLTEITSLDDESFDFAIDYLHVEKTSKGGFF